MANRARGADSPPKKKEYLPQEAKWPSAGSGSDDRNDHGDCDDRDYREAPTITKNATKMAAKAAATLKKQTFCNHA